jgi:hypothetical protein
MRRHTAVYLVLLFGLAIDSFILQRMITELVTSLLHCVVGTLSLIFIMCLLFYEITDDTYIYVRKKKIRGK